MLAIEGDGWFVETPTGQLGPITSAAVERLVSTGEVRLATLVWHKSLEDWTTLQSILAMDASWEEHQRRSLIRWRAQPSRVRAAAGLRARRRPPFALGA